MQETNALCVMFERLLADHQIIRKMINEGIEPRDVAKRYGLPHLALIEHVEECKRCFERCIGCQDEDALATIYVLMLPEDEPDPESDRWLTQALADAEESNRRLQQAVQEGLLPRLSQGLRDVVQTRGWHPCAVFIATHAISMGLSRMMRLNKRRAGKIIGEPRVTISVEGDVDLGNRQSLESGVLCTEIRACASEYQFDEAESFAILRWIIQAAREVPDLFLDWDAVPIENGGVRLTMRPVSLRHRVKEQDLWRLNTDET